MKYSHLLLLASLASFSSFAESPDENEDTTGLCVSASIDAYSAYVWRGQVSNYRVWQPSVDIAWNFGEEFGAISANVWTSNYLTHKGSPRRGMGTSEIDYSIQYGIPLGPFEVSVGNVWYTYPNQSRYGTHSTSELFAGISYANDFVVPEITAYWDCFDNGNTDPSMVYVTGKLSREFDIYYLIGRPEERTDYRAITLTPSVELGFGDGAYMNYYGGVNKAEFSDVTVGLELNYPITDNLNLSGCVKYMWLTSHTLRHSDYTTDGKEQLLYCGLSVGYDF